MSIKNNSELLGTLRVIEARVGRGDDHSAEELEILSDLLDDCSKYVHKTLAFKRRFKDIYGKETTG